MNPKLRTLAREYAVQAIYGWQLSGNSVDSMELQTVVDKDTSTFELEYFQRLFRGVTAQVDELDSRIKPYLGRLPEEIDPIEKSIIRLATFELTECLEVPFRVVINEAIELAKRYGAEDGHKFVNGVLDKAVRKLREVEFSVKR